MRVRTRRVVEDQADQRDHREVRNMGEVSVGSLPDLQIVEEGDLAPDLALDLVPIRRGETRNSTRQISSGTRRRVNRSQSDVARLRWRLAIDQVRLALAEGREDIFDDNASVTEEAKTNAKWRLVLKRLEEEGELRSRQLREKSQAASERLVRRSREAVRKVSSNSRSSSRRSRSREVVDRIRVRSQSAGRALAEKSRDYFRHSTELLSRYKVRPESSGFLLISEPGESLGSSGMSLQSSPGLGRRPASGLGRHSRREGAVDSLDEKKNQLDLCSSSHPCPKKKKKKKVINLMHP